MPTPADAALAALDAVERGFVLGALLLGSAEDGDTTAALLPPSRERCAAALAAIAALPRAERVRVTGTMAREAMAVFPAGLDSVNPEQLAAVLADESAETSFLLARGAPRVVQAAVENAREPVARLEDPGEREGALLAELQRAALAPIAALPPRADGAPERRALALAQRPVAVLLAETSQAGARQLGQQLAEAEGEGLGTADLLLALAQRLPAALGQALLEGAESHRRAPAVQLAAEAPSVPPTPTHQRR
jgi:hypothetical protein